MISGLAAHTVLVVGDVILDEYITGRAQRMSREAPIPVLELIDRHYIPGGAANPASNIVALGARALQAGVVGDDDPARVLRAALESRGIDTALLLACDDRPTTLKTRIMAQMGLRFPQQVARVDTLSREPIASGTESDLIQRVQAALADRQIQAVLVSDYHNGLLTPVLVRALREAVSGTDVLLTADAQGNLVKYDQFDLVKCNADDATAYLGRDLVDDEDFAVAARDLCAGLHVRGAMVITRGADGATVGQADGRVVQCPAPAIRDVYDTVGAGDTAIAVMTLARLAGGSWQEAVMLSNYASGLVVQHVGNYTPSADELLAML